MFKLAVISDSHGNKARVEQFAEIANREKYDVVVHCGDGASDAKYLERTLTMPLYSVSGNCDVYWSEKPREIWPEFDGVRFVVTHGDKYSVKWDLTALSYHTEEAHAKAALFGHTHSPFAGYVGRVLLLNPGALKDGSYAEITIEYGELSPMFKKL